jgi:Ca-activated chloride channel family protein
MKQIIIVTDGYSNAGISPVAAAAQAFAKGVVVNVIGVVDRETDGMQGEREIAAIARSGGGVYRVVVPAQLGTTMQMMTRHTVAATIQQVVHQELRTILNDESVTLAALPPAKRAEIVRSMDRLAEQSPLKIALLIDASASMRNKFSAVREAVWDFMISLQARSGTSELAVLHYPGNSSNIVEVDVEWTRELAKVTNILYKINVRGTTPTGPAILETLALFGLTDFVHGSTFANPSWPLSKGDSAWGDYVV